MAAGADCIDDLDVVRAGGMKQIFGGVYAAVTLGQLLREFTHRHTLQLASVARAHLVALVQHSDLLPGIEARVCVGIDSLLRPVYGHAKRGVPYGTRRSRAGRSRARASTDHEIGADAAVMVPAALQATA